MGKIIRSVVALLLVVACVNSVAFATTTSDSDFPEPLVGEIADSVEMVKITSETIFRLEDSNNISVTSEENIITFRDMEYVVLDDSQIVIDDNLSRSRATTSVSWSVDASVLKKANTTFPMEAGESVIINCSYTPRGAEVAFGLIAPDNRFYYIVGSQGSINRTILIDERGEYRFAVHNKSSNTVSVTGFIEY